MTRGVLGLPTRRGPKLPANWPYGHGSGTDLTNYVEIRLVGEGTSPVKAAQFDDLSLITVEKKSSSPIRGGALLKMTPRLVDARIGARPGAAKGRAKWERMRQRYACE